MRIGIFAATAALVMASPAVAHSRLVSATPAPDSVVAAPDKLQLVFSEALVANFSGVDLAMTDMPGMKMGSPMKMPVTTALSADGKTMVVTIAKPLPRGAYKLDWHAASTAPHRGRGANISKLNGR